MLCVLDVGKLYFGFNKIEDVYCVNFFVINIFNCLIWVIVGFLVWCFVIMCFKVLCWLNVNVEMIFLLLFSCLIDVIFWFDFDIFYIFKILIWLNKLL